MADNPLHIAADFIRQFEGCRLTAYQDQKGIWTVGYGSTGPDVTRDTVWTLEQAEQRLQADLVKFQVSVRQLMKNNPLAPKQEAALISMAYNLGPACLNGTELQTTITQKDWLNAPAEMIRFCHVDGRPNKGLLIRRLREAALFLEGTA